MTECERIGTSGNCGPDCEVYLRGECSEPEEMVERLEDEELQQHRDLYGGSDMSNVCSAACNSCSHKTTGVRLFTLTGEYVYCDDCKADETKSKDAKWAMTALGRIHVEKYRGLNKFFSVKQKSKGQKMKMLAKVARMGIMAWILFGAAKLVILVNPLMVKFGYFMDNYLGEPGNLNVWDATLGGWVFCILGIATFCGASYGLQKFSSWLFGWLGKK